jgi:UDP-GlcNAc:undecaprenyl-phosphate GlcNAc-1-phosphate transferase
MLGVITNDSGSTTLGFLAAFLGVDVATAGGTANRSIWFPLLVAAIPLLDALRVVTQRIIRSRSPFGGDRCHFYDVLLSRGWSPRKVAIISWSAAATGGLLGVGLVRQAAAGVWWLTALGLIVIGLGVTTGRALKSLRKDREAVSQ